MKSMAVLNLFLTHERLTLNQIMECLNAPKTSVYRMTESLVDMGFLTKDEAGNYELGLLFLQFGQLVHERLNIRRVALPVMQELRDDVGEAVNLIVQDHREAVYIEKVDTKHPVRVYNERPGRRVPMYAGACPRILLTYMTPVEQARYLSETELLPIGRGTITDAAELRSVLQESRANGYTLSHSELQNETSAVAAAVFDHAGNVIAGMSVAGPTSRFGEDELPRLIEKVKEAAQTCSSRLGYQPYSISQT